MPVSKVKSGKPITRQQEARKRKFAGNPYWSNLAKKKLRRVLKSCGLDFAKKWAKERGMSIQPDRI